MKEDENELQSKEAKATGRMHMHVNEGFSSVIDKFVPRPSSGENSLAGLG